MRSDEHPGPVPDDVPSGLSENTGDDAAGDRDASAATAAALPPSWTTPPDHAGDHEGRRSARAPQTRALTETRTRHTHPAAAASGTSPAPGVGPVGDDHDRGTADTGDTEDTEAAEVSDAPAADETSRARDRVATALSAPVPPAIRTAGKVAVWVAVIFFAAGWVVGARDPMLAPVQLTPGPATAGATPAERVYATVKDSVVTVQVPGGGTGSGFFYRPDRVVTNNHVVSSSPEVIARLEAGLRPVVTLALPDGRVRDATVLAVDPRLDLAILETPTGLGIRPLPFADSTDLTPGEPAFVVGSPFGLATSVSSGIVSGIDRSSQFAADPVQSSLIQTDAAVNPGNSGGPLLNAAAAVVGVVTLRPDEAAGRSTQGLAFALPSAAVVAAIDQLERYGVVSHPQLGVLLTAPDPDRAGERGVVISQVVDGSAADAAGLKVGDQLLAVAGKPARHPADVVDALVGKRAGDRLELSALRDGPRFTTPVELRERPAGP